MKKVRFCFIICLLAGLVGFSCWKENPRKISVLSDRKYKDLKVTFFATDTTKLTVVIASGDGRKSEGVLIISPAGRVVLVPADFFSTKHSSTTYTYVVDGQKHPLGYVFSLPKPNDFTNEDSVVCMPGKLRVIESSSF